MSECRSMFLNECITIVKERGESYGPPTQHFGRTIRMINSLFADRLIVPLETGDWAVMMMLDKIARNQHEHQRDNCLDIAGYAACMQEVADECDTCDCKSNICEGAD